MKISQLFSIYSQLRYGDASLKEVTQVTSRSDEVDQNTVFVAIRGERVDGHNYLKDCVERGAIGLVVEDAAQIPQNYKGALVVVEDSREALSRLLGKFYGNPADQLFCVGVTGTNGKTTVTYMIEAILNSFGWKTGVMGTVDHHLGEHVWKSQLTTPDSLELHRRLSDFSALGAKAAVFEVSSHGLSQGRVDFIPFDVLVFTNLTRDHLDYYESMDQYFRAKERLFSEIPFHSKDKQVRALINGDDSYGASIQVAQSVRLWYFGEKECDFQFEVLSQSYHGTEFDLKTPFGKTKIFLSVPGYYNVFNAVAAVGVGLAAGVSLETCATAMKNFKGVPGRLERVPSKREDIFVFIDYAHTDNALSSVLSTLCEIRRNQKGNKSRLITVYGCGGDRDEGKRPLMAQAALEGSDFVILTSDNPRTEDPMKIIEDGVKGVPKDCLEHTFFIQVDREKAIQQAVDMATKKGDVILIAGKGHESYQCFGDKKIDFSDYEVAREMLL